MILGERSFVVLLVYGEAKPLALVGNPSFMSVESYSAGFSSSISSFSSIYIDFAT